MVAKAERRLAAHQAEEMVSEAVRIRGPLSYSEVLDELLRTAALAVAWRDVLEAKVVDLQAWRYAADGPGTEQLRSEVALFERAIDRTARVLDLVARLDIHQRKARLNEETGALIGHVLSRALDRAGITGEQRALVHTVLAEELRRVGEPDRKVRV